MNYSIYWEIPFIGTLLSVAFFPILAPKFWQKNSGKIFAFWALSICVPLWFRCGATNFADIICGVMFETFLPFIILISALYIITGGIYLTISRKLTAGTNIAIIGFGALISSWIGTTGAAMLMIRPLLRLNANRKYNVHLVIFFIFLVANIGGGTTPIGDPPLFVGFLEGIDFFWTTKNLSITVYSIVAFMLFALYFIDKLLLKKEISQNQDLSDNSNSTATLNIAGKRNLPLLLIAVSSVILSSRMNVGSVQLLSASIPINNIIRDLILLGTAILSLGITPKNIRRRNSFSFAPLKEITELFITVFITLIPVEHMLHLGSAGPFGVLFNWLSSEGVFSAARCFWTTGFLSSILDNAPTYLMFFHLAGGDAEYFMNAGHLVLKAISLGAVFFGAMTYIGNAPNFMVKSIAQEYGYKMPSFFGYMKWSCLVLIPIFVVVVYFAF